MEHLSPGEQEEEKRHVEQQASRAHNDLELLRRGAHFVRTAEGNLQLVLDDAELEKELRFDAKDLKAGRSLDLSYRSFNVRPEQTIGRQDAIWVVAHNATGLKVEGTTAGEVQLQAFRFDELANIEPGSQVVLPLNQEQIEFLLRELPTVLARAKRKAQAHHDVDEVKTNTEALPSVDEVRDEDPHV